MDQSTDFWSWRRRLFPRGAPKIDQEYAFDDYTHVYGASLWRYGCDDRDLKQRALKPRFRQRVRVRPTRQRAVAGADQDRACAGGRRQRKPSMRSAARRRSAAWATLPRQAR